MKTAVIYARVSSSNDRQDTSRQIEDLKKYAISQDIEIVNIFQEHISGAKKIEERQILGECLEYCKRESVNILLLSELSRLGRSTLQVLRSLDILHESKVSVYIQNLGLYTLQPNGEVNPIASIMVTVLAEMANIERSNIQYRLNSGRANYIAKGGKLGRKTGSTKTDDKKKEEYKEVIALLRKGYSIRNIAKLQSIGILDRLGPKKIVIVSSSPQVRYPDYYGIDMAKMSEFIAFRAAVELLKERDMKDVIAAAYRKSKDQVGLPKEQMINYVKNIYAPFTDEEISGKMVELLTPKGTKAKVEIVYQPLEGLHEACPHHKGDWYFSGNYPTPGGVKMVNRTFIDYIEQMYQF